MDQAAIGKFISQCRKEKHLTQAQLAERLGVSDRAVSKWETGRSMPDASIMLDLCEQIDITVNDLFNARRINMDNYKEIAERTMLELREREEQNTKKMLSLEIVIAALSIPMLLSFLAIVFLIDMSKTSQGILIAGGIVQFLTAMAFCLKIETEAGYYECPNCGERYVPKFRNVIFAQHINRTSKMRCPHCGEKGWHKKVLTKQK